MYQPRRNAIAPEPQNAASLGFFKLVVGNLDQHETFFREALSMTTVNRVDGPGFTEIMLTSPRSKFALVLFHWTDGRPLTVGNAHGPVGFIVPDLEEAIARATNLGAAVTQGPLLFSGTRLVFMTGPEGHPIELIESRVAS